jgi:hypothetical protein
MSRSPPEDTPDVEQPAAATQPPPFAATFAEPAGAQQLDYMNRPPHSATHLSGQRGVGFNGGRPPGEPESRPASHDGATSSSTSSSDSSEEGATGDMYGSALGSGDERAGRHGRHFCGSGEGDTAGARQLEVELGQTYKQASAEQQTG